LNGQTLQVQDICLRAASLLKNIINTSWGKPGEEVETVDKENVSQN